MAGPPRGISNHARRLVLAEPFARDGGLPAPARDETAGFEIALGTPRGRSAARGQEQQQKAEGERHRHGQATLGAASAGCQAAVCSGGPTEGSTQWRSGAGVSGGLGGAGAPPPPPPPPPRP